jgi:hypothetical protein
LVAPGLGSVKDVAPRVQVREDETRGNTTADALSVSRMSAYRRSAEDLETRRDHLARRLADVRELRTRGDDEDLGAREVTLTREIRSLDLPRPRSRLPLLARVFSVEAPCTEDWNAMVGGARVRRCSACDRDVFDLAEMTQAEVDALLEAHGAPPCVRLRRRADGTLVTKDACPPLPVSRPAVGLALGAAAALVAAGTAYVASQAVAHHTHPATVPVTVRAPRAETVVLGMMRELPSSREASEPTPPWERPDVVAAGFDSVDHFTRARNDEP